MKTTAKYISDLRKRAGLTQAEFADTVVGVKPKTFSRWETGYAKPRPDSLEKIKAFERTYFKDKPAKTTKSVVEKALDAVPKAKPVPSGKAPRLSAVAKRIRAVRKQAGLSQVEFGIELGVFQETVSAWERGVTPIPGYEKARVIHHLDRIAGSVREHTRLNPVRIAGAVLQRKPCGVSAAPSSGTANPVEISKEDVDKLVYSLADARDVAPSHVRAALRRALNEPTPLPTRLSGLLKVAIDDGE